MRIQHNIMAINAYRNYTNNVNAMKSSLEKLSSGYKINRAGDDAAGLAISEKMRAQITGLETAQKNAKDGISLVQTAEGALTEVHDMLNRMVELATMSANGTYDNTTDRAQLQKEMDQLNSEINRIADSAASSGFVGGDNTKGGIQLTGQYLGSNTGKLNESDDSVRYHKDAAVAGKTSFTVDLDGLGYEAKSGTAVTGLNFALQGGTAGTMGSGNMLSLKSDGSATLAYDLVANGEGKITSEDIAKAIQAKIDENEGKVYVKAGAFKGTTATDATTVGWIEYSVTRDGDKLRFEMTDKGYSDACDLVAGDEAAAAPEYPNYFKGNYNFSVGYKATTGSEAEKFMSTNKDWIKGNPSTCEVNEGTTPKGTIYAQAYIRFDPANAGDNKGLNKVTDFITDGKGLMIGDEYYLFAASDATFNTEYADNVKVVDIRDLTNLTDAKKGTDEFTNELRQALDRLSVVAKDNEMFDVQVEKRGTMLVLNERTTYTGSANLTEKDWGLEKQIQAFESAQSTTVVEKEAGKALTLQIGDTAEDFNQLKVNIKDIHTTTLGLDKIRIDDQTSAAAAVDVIKNAINMVSDIRGTLGATQNRLDHTINNLSVMTENIQDAESTIRDTDVASEMMKYTKNNILIQSAQAMLAQANQVPQEVLQLLQ